MAFPLGNGFSWLALCSSTNDAGPLWVPIAIAVGTSCLLLSSFSKSAFRHVILSAAGAKDLLLAQEILSYPRASLRMTCSLVLMKREEEKKQGSRVVGRERAHLRYEHPFNHDGLRVTRLCLITPCSAANTNL